VELALESLLRPGSTLCTMKIVHTPRRKPDDAACMGGRKTKEGKKEGKKKGEK